MVVNVRLPQPASSHPQKVPCPQWGPAFTPAVLGVFNCRSNKNSPDNSDDSAFFRKKKIQQI
jgi:hypothetical protein